MLVLANYPNRDGRIGNGVGLDTPAAIDRGAARARSARAIASSDIPDERRRADARGCCAGPTNAAPGRAAEETFPRSDYGAFFATLPRAAQDKVERALGRARARSVLPRGRARLRHLRDRRRCAAAMSSVALQPARGYNIDPKASYHDPDLPPPHGYLAFHAWIADGVRAHAVVHMGKHGNLEWLPGKAVALSAECFPEAALGPLPHLYPFIVNDPGEGTQAKRRAQAVIVDHLTPPLTRAESYGRLAELERLVDEYYAAAGGDPRRLPLLRGADPRSRARRGARPRLRHRRRRRRRRGARQARRLSLRAEGNADPRRAAHLRPRARGRAARPICWWRSRACRAARRRIRPR